MKPRTLPLLIRVAILAALALACAGAPRAPSLGGLAYDPFYEGRSQWEIAATPEGSAAPPAPTQTRAPIAPATPQPTANIEPPAGPTSSPTSNQAPINGDTPEPAAQPSNVGYADLVAQALSLGEEQRATFFASLAGLSANNWQGQLQATRFDAERAVLMINIAPTTDGTQDGPDVLVNVTSDAAQQFNIGDNVQISGVIVSARSEPGTDLLVEIANAVVERAP